MMIADKDDPISSEVGPVEHLSGVVRPIADLHEADLIAEIRRITPD